MFNKLLLARKPAQVPAIFAHDDFRGLHADAINGDQVHAGHPMQQAPRRFLSTPLDRLDLFLILQRLERIAIGRFTA